MYSTEPDEMGSLIVYIWQDHQKIIIWQRDTPLRSHYHYSDTHWVIVYLNLEEVVDNDDPFWVRLKSSAIKD